MKNADETVIIDSVIRICSRHCAPGVQMTAATALSDAGLTSLARIQLLIELEDEFRVTFPDEMLTDSTFSNSINIANAIVSLLD